MPTSQSSGMTFCLLSLLIGFLSGLTATLAGAQPRVQLGPRPYYLVEKMEEGTLEMMFAMLFIATVGLGLFCRCLGFVCSYHGHVSQAFFRSGGSN